MLDDQLNVFYASRKGKRKFRPREIIEELARLVRKKERTSFMSAFLFLLLLERDTLMNGVVFFSSSSLLEFSSSSSSSCFAIYLSMISQTIIINETDIFFLLSRRSFSFLRTRNPIKRMGFRINDKLVDCSIGKTELFFFFSLSD